MFFVIAEILEAFTHGPIDIIGLAGDIFALILRIFFVGAKRKFLRIIAID
jgi:hypothetical protein